MPKVIALQEWHYAGKTYMPGAEFEVSESDLNIAKAIGKVKDAPVVAPAVMPVEQARPVEPAKNESLFAAKAQPAEKDDQTKAPRRRYMRRDLTAQE